MVRKEFTSETTNWGYPIYVKRAEIFGERAITKIDVSEAAGTQRPRITKHCL